MEIGYCIIYERLKNSSKFGWKIQKLYEICKNKLGEIRRTFPNYTLHNIDHSIHVLYYMGQVIEKKIEQFDELELYVMACAAFLHDIGMAFSEREKEAVKAGEYDNEKIKYKFVADRMEEKEAIKEFVRIIHAQKARKFCENYENEKGFESLLDGIASSVGKICESHDHGKEWIQKELATQKAYEKEKYNPRFIALLLRLGDILDFDCKRAPLEIFENINDSDEMSEYSREEWKKQMGITYDEKIEKVENTEQFKVVFFGEQKDPQVYRKMKEYFHWIEEELHLVNEISESFSKDEELTKQQKEKYKIKFLGNVNNHVDIPDYDFTNLKMSVDYKNITNILMGENIYRNKKYALRELLQNALDACRYLKRMRGDSEFYNPQIMIILDEKKNQVIIKDNGIGMSKEILKNYFLSVGKSYYQSDEFLNNSYFYKPIANYGIGFLSCFLLSDEVIVKTKPYNSNEGTNCIHLKKGSEFIYWDKKEKGLHESGTEIILNYEQFKEGFFNKDEIERELEKLNIEAVLEIAKEKVNLKDVLKNDIEDISYKIASKARGIHWTREGILKNRIKKFIEEIVLKYEKGEFNFKNGLKNKLKEVLEEIILAWKVEEFIGENILKDEVDIMFNIDGTKIKCTQFSLNDLIQNGLYMLKSSNEILLKKLDFDHIKKFRIGKELRNDLKKWHVSLKGLNKEQLKYYGKAFLPRIKLAMVQRIIDISNYLDGVQIFVNVYGFNRQYNILKRIYAQGKADKVFYESDIIEQKKDIFEGNNAYFLEFNLIDSSQARILKTLQKYKSFSIEQVMNIFGFKKVCVLIPWDKCMTIKDERYRIFSDCNEDIKKYIKDIYNKLGNISFEELLEEKLDRFILVNLTSLFVIYSDKSEEIFLETYYIFNFHFYNKGILVNKESSAFMNGDYFLDFFEIKECFLNIDDNSVNLNVARDELNEEDKEELKYSIIKATYLYFIDNYKQYNITENEKQLLEQYIKLRYSKTTKYLKQ